MLVDVKLPVELDCKLALPTSLQRRMTSVTTNVMFNMAPRQRLWLTEMHHEVDSIAGVALFCQTKPWARATKVWLFFAGGHAALRTQRQAAGRDWCGRFEAYLNGCSTSTVCIQEAGELVSVPAGLPHAVLTLYHPGADAITALIGVSYKPPVEVYHAALRKSSSRSVSDFVWRGHLVATGVLPRVVVQKRAFLRKAEICRRMVQQRVATAAVATHTRAKRRKQRTE